VTVHCRFAQFPGKIEGKRDRRTKNASEKWNHPKKRVWGRKPLKKKTHRAGGKGESVQDSGGFSGKKRGIWSDKKDGVKDQPKKSAWWIVQQLMGKPNRGTKRGVALGCKKRG